MALISPATVARQYGVSPTQLRQWRRQGIGPEYFQFTARTVSYSDDYLRDWFNDPRNAHLLAQNAPTTSDMSRQDRRVRQGRHRDDR
ncbi:transposase [Arthrobacter sp. SIMBA_036]|uniref:helix-turn-helix transcriptional regulator n=1 Tax=Arthrobacter sp. SIMBA_036 TaxID=3085778 RepID=UPI003978795A